MEGPQRVKKKKLQISVTIYNMVACFDSLIDRVMFESDKAYFLLHIASWHHSSLFLYVWGEYDV